MKRQFQNPRRRRGFTLVELMVAMVIVSLLTSIIYGLFIRTSDAMYEVDSLADTVNKTRFALEHVRYDLAAAGSQATPDSATDPNVRPQDSTRRLMAIVPYGGWQNAQESVMTDAAVRAANPEASFDGFIVIGAYDFPQSFLVGNVESDSVSIANDGRGLQRMAVNNPFFIGQGGVTEDQVKAIASILDNPARMLRITDRDGFHQFVRIGNVADADVNKIDLGFATGSGLQFRQGGEIYGIEAVREADERYEAALIDAYWYRVVPVVGERGNFALVRERINLGELATTLGTSDGVLSSVPSGALLAGEQRVITDRVVDFQIWFDCAEGAIATGGGAISEVGWVEDWETPDGTEAPNDCIQPATGADFSRGRVAHIRLSLRTENERANRLHLDLPDLEPGFETEGGPLQTFDVIPEAPGAAQVVTMQTSVELTNFALRGL